MFEIILFQPEIPPNTGNIIRVCANTGSTLHLVHPLGFALDDRRMRRAGLDYHEFATVREHPSLEACLAVLAEGTRVFALSTHGTRSYAEPVFRAGDAFLFGPETRGLPPSVRAALPAEQLLRIPMRPGNRSLNLSNAVAVLLYEAWRQQGFAGAAGEL
ncbi:MAG: tRNA (uridine(34)/cytosine(34)/5-carboxymethylaminomethyluridine(34)-2'-O)-methyltransferase TrmL [Gammaproteobacteria bacterium]|nr:tRNA (uridine(34)/cytosine(34)/5-carboxymethylaminomethyluridine(34)-2'-O)-methyltransferase TrmL [Gammaproteobacteria bacterium]